MLQNFIPRLIHELELGDMDLSSSNPGAYVFPLEEGLSITMTDLPNGFLLKAHVAPYPKVKEELFATQVMLANLFGQGTKGAILGLSLDGTFLTLTLIVDYPVEYKEFKESLEDFINVIDFWRDEALNPMPLKS